MEAHSSVESYLDNVAFDLINTGLPDWYMNPKIKAAFAQRPAWDAVVESSTLSVAAGLDAVLSSSTPPSIDFFLSLPDPSATVKQWGVYAVVLVLPGSTPRLYIGSGTDSMNGIQTRCKAYIDHKKHLSRLTTKALKEGYEIASFGLLCWTDFPTPQLVARLRARMLVLEAVFTIFFFASVKYITDDLFIPDFFLWQRQDVTWDPLCSHLSLMESMRGADLELTEEEINLAAALLAQRGAEKTRRYRQRERVKDSSAFAAKGLQQRNAWMARNPVRAAEIAAGVRKRAKESARFRCDTCNHNAATQSALDYHLRSKAHLDAVRNGGKVLKELTEAALNRRASRAAGKDDPSLFCSKCKKQLSSAWDLKRHNNSQKHQAALKRKSDAE